MELSIQPSLVERTVFEAARQDAALRPHYERQFAECYDHRDQRRRDHAFAVMHERWFDELGLRDLIARLVNEFPHVRERVTRLMVTHAPGAKARTVELFGVDDRYTVVMAVSPATLLDRPAFEYWARHELMHVDDMLDPAFGFDAAKRPIGATAAARNRAQDRYAVLWALSVDIRLSQRGLAPPDVGPRRMAELGRAFGLADAGRSGCSFETLQTQPIWQQPNHSRMLDWAAHGLPQTSEIPGDAPSTGLAPPAGAPCPLCGFQTFDWTCEAGQLAELEGVILPDFPGWTVHQPICTRCADIYRGCLVAA
jgi:hypothetical protein